MVRSRECRLVAQEVTGSVLPTFGVTFWSAWLGILIHLILAIALGLGLAFALWHVLSASDGACAEYVVAILDLAVVWAVNFFVALPYINSEFVDLLPYRVTLVSKLLFGSPRRLSSACALFDWPDCEPGEVFEKIE